MKGGYIYGFQLDGCAYTKLANQQNETEKTPEDSLVERIKKHVRDRGPALRAVFKIPVPFVPPERNLVKIHLAAGRMRKKCSCKNYKGQPLNHGNHIERFSNSLDKI
jgi:hypothetical protein